MTAASPLGASPLGSESQSGVYSIVQNPGTFGIAGQTAQLVFGFFLSALPGSFVTTPNAAFTSKGLALGTGNFAARITVAITANRRMIAAMAVFTATGKATKLYPAYVLNAVPAAIAFVGSVTALDVNRVSGMVAGSFVISAQATMTYIRTMPLPSGTYAVSGQPAMVQAGFTHFFATGQFYAVGAAARLAAMRRNPETPGTYTLIGHATAAQAARQSTTISGITNANGNTATLTVGRRMVMQPRQIVVTGSPLSMRVGRIMHLDTGHLGLLKPTPVLQTIRSRRLALQPGTFRLVGQAAPSVPATYVLNAAPGAFHLVRPGGTLARRYVLVGTPAQTQLFGSDLMQPNAQFARPLLLAEPRNGIRMLPGFFGVATNQGLLGRQLAQAAGAFHVTGSHT